MLRLLKKFGRSVRNLFRRQWMQRLTASLILIGVLIGLGVAVTNYINAPSNGTITAFVPTVLPKSASTVGLKGAYADFAYPSDFNPIAADKPVPPQLVIYSFVAHHTESLLLSIQIESLPSGNLSDNGSYNFRKAYPHRYTQVVKAINGQDIYIMSDVTSGTYNKTAFFVHNGKVAVVNLNGGPISDSATLDQALTDLVTSWEWH